LISIWLIRGRWKRREDKNRLPFIALAKLHFMSMIDGIWL
jgi:hypothetical protein